MIRTKDRDKTSAIKIAEKLRKLSGVKTDKPMDYGDAGDTDRGMVVYDYVDQEITPINWPDCPKY